CSVGSILSRTSALEGVGVFHPCSLGILAVIRFLIAWHRPRLSLRGDIHRRIPGDSSSRRQRYKCRPVAKTETYRRSVPEWLLPCNGTERILATPWIRQSELRQLW